MRLYTMILWFLFLIGVLIYLLRSREGFISIDDSTPVELMQGFIQEDIDSLKSSERLIYVIYKSVDAKKDKAIDDAIKKVKVYKEYKVRTVFPVTNTVLATSVFSKFFIPQIDYDQTTILTDNPKTTKKDNTQLMRFANIDTPMYEEITHIITTNNKPR